MASRMESGMYGDRFVLDRTDLETPSSLDCKHFQCCQCGHIFSIDNLCAERFMKCRYFDMEAIANGRAGFKLLPKEEADAVDKVYKGYCPKCKSEEMRGEMGRSYTYGGQEYFDENMPRN